MAEDRIKMAHVLADIDQYEKNGQLHVFGLHYVKINGQKGLKAKCRKSGNKIVTLGTAIGAMVTTGYKTRVKENGLLLLVDHTTGNPFALKISLITHYNGIRIQH